MWGRMKVISMEDWNESWNSGGIFGPTAADDEMLDAMIDAMRDGVEMRDDGTYTNHTQELIERRARSQRRQRMLLVERLVDELPETIEWATGLSRAQLVSLKAKARDRAVAVATLGMHAAAEVMALAYVKEIRRTEAARKLGGLPFAPSVETGASAWGRMKLDAIAGKVRSWLGSNDQTAAAE